MGGGLYAWRATGAEVLAVTLEENRPHLVPHGATIIWGNSTEDETRWLLQVHLAGRQPDLVFIDGDHSTGGARADWELARGLGARIVGFHDIAHRIHGPDIAPVYAAACEGRHHHEIIAPDPETDGTGLVWL